jgi:hypothetical protein
MKTVKPLEDSDDFVYLHLDPEADVTVLEDSDDFPEPNSSWGDGESGETKPELTTEALLGYVDQVVAAAMTADFQLEAEVNQQREFLIRTTCLLRDLAIATTKANEELAQRVALLEGQNAHLYDVLDAMTTTDPVERLGKALDVFAKAEAGVYNA